MTDEPQDPTNRELLERVYAIEAENARLCEVLADVKAAQDVLMAGMVGELRSINDFLWPVFHKMFPQFSAMQKRVDEIVPPCFADPRADRQRDDKDR